MASSFDKQSSQRIANAVRKIEKLPTKLGPAGSRGRSVYHWQPQYLTIDTAASRPGMYNCTVYKSAGTDVTITGSSAISASEIVTTTSITGYAINVPEIGASTHNVPNGTAALGILTRINSDGTRIYIFFGTLSGKTEDVTVVETEGWDGTDLYQAKIILHYVNGIYKGTDDGGTTNIDVPTDCGPPPG